MPYRHPWNRPANIGRTNLALSALSALAITALVLAFTVARPAASPSNEAVSAETPTVPPPVAASHA